MTYTYEQLAKMIDHSLLSPALTAEALEQGVDFCVSSWSRMAPNTLPAMAKII